MLSQQSQGKLVNSLMSKRTFLIMLCIILVLSGCAKSTQKAAQSWAYPFVIYNGSAYAVTDETVSGIGKQIGTVRYYSTDERSQEKNLFSNCYQAGTELYSIQNIDIQDAIAVKIADGKYTKLVKKTDIQPSR